MGDDVAHRIDNASPDPWRWTAWYAVSMLLRKAISPSELIDCAVRRIEDTEGRVNALTTLCIDRARRRARVIERRRAGYAGVETGRWLGGLPIVVKDVIDVAGVRSTFGSPIFATRVPQRSDIAIRTLERHGAIVIAKSNTPAFASASGLGTQNELFGVTRNPWNLHHTCGGSSGGSAAAVASGQAWLAVGTDLGGSIRQPASFCSIVGLRPSPGRVARSSVDPLDDLCVTGPMARNVTDIALMLDAMSGMSQRDQLSLPKSRIPFIEYARRARPPARVAYSSSLRLVDVDPEIADICRRAVARFGNDRVVEECPDFALARESLAVLRPRWIARHWGHLLDQYRDHLDPDFAARIDLGLRMSPAQVHEAEEKRHLLSSGLVEFFRRYDVLACPVAPIAPFELGSLNPPIIAKQRNEIEWMLLTYAVSLIGCPAISIPCGFTAGGLPVGLQLVGRPGGDGDLLGAAAYLEARIDLPFRTPVDLRPSPGKDNRAAMSAHAS